MKLPRCLLYVIFPDLEWKLTYVGSAETEAHDQVLDSVLVGPVPEGRHMFVFSVRVSFYVVLRLRHLIEFVSG